MDQTLTAADGWGGDAFVAYEENGVSCVRIAYVGDTPADLTQMRNALRSWVAKAPKAPASVKVEGSRLLFESCDPGATARKVATGGSRDAVLLALRRTYLSSQLVDTGFEIDQARCSADALVRRFTAKQLNDPKLDKGLVQRTIAPCLAADRGPAAQSEQTRPLPDVPYGPPVERNPPPRWKINKKDAAVIAVRVAAPFVLGAIVRAMAKK